MKMKVKRGTANIPLRIMADAIMSAGFSRSIAGGWETNLGPIDTVELFLHLLGQAPNKGVLHDGRSDVNIDVSGNGDVMAIGFPAVGMIYVYVKRMGFWRYTQRIQSPIGKMGVYFACDFQLSHDGAVLAVGAKGVGSSDMKNIGAVYVYRNINLERDKWVFAEAIEPALPCEDLQFGSSIALSECGSDLEVCVEGIGYSGPLGDSSHYHFHGGEWHLADVAGVIGKLT